jgi:GNAT superfamily N-acetyltransferase
MHARLSDVAGHRWPDRIDFGHDEGVSPAAFAIPGRSGQARGDDTWFATKTVTLRHGHRVALRVARRADAPCVQEFVRGLSATSRRNRFFAPVRELSADQLERVTRCAPPEALTILAEAAQGKHTRIIAMGQYAACDPPEAEFAIVVDDRWQRQGLATRLLDTLAGQAARAGFGIITGLVLADNWPMLAFLAQHRCELTEMQGRVVRATLALRETKPLA